VNLLLKHVLSALYPRTAEFPGIADLPLDAFLRRFRREASALMRLGMYLGLLVFVLSPLGTVFVPLPSFLLPRAWLDRHAERIASSGVYPARALIMLLKVIAGLCWGADPAVRARLGLPPLPPDPESWRHA
jgi:hypothetical protein